MDGYSHILLIMMWEILIAPVYLSFPPPPPPSVHRSGPKGTLHVETFGGNLAAKLSSRDAFSDHEINFHIMK